MYKLTIHSKIVKCNHSKTAQWSVVEMELIDRKFEFKTLTPLLA